jgi:hypothetical protein
MMASIQPSDTGKHIGDIFENLKVTKRQRAMGYLPIEATADVRV